MIAAVCGVLILFHLAVAWCVLAVWSRERYRGIERSVAIVGLTGTAATIAMLTRGLL